MDARLALGAYSIELYMSQNSPFKNFIFLWLIFVAKNQKQHGEH